MVILVDCDNFFASCERIMQPRLLAKPVAVLSNNDGCVIARSAEVKQAGVKMGQPYHECKALLDSIGAEVVSGNYLLYRHFAKRLQGILRAVPADAIEIYSIDESFLVINDKQIEDSTKWAFMLRQTIYDWTGLPVSIGIGQSKALAKLAAQIAKKDKGVFSLIDSDEATNVVLRDTPVDAVWGIGRRLAPKLHVCGIHTAWEFVTIRPDDRALKLLDATTRDLVYQLRGWTVGSTQIPNHQKSIMFSRSFGVAVTDKAALRAALAEFCTELGAKLRRKRLVADKVSVTLRYRVPGTTHGKGRSMTIHLDEWSDDTFALLQAAEYATDALFDEDKVYSKAVVVLPELRNMQQMSLLAKPGVGHEDLLAAIDTLVRRYGATGPRSATIMLDDSWRGKRSSVSPYNHAEWQKLPIVTA